MLWWGGIHEKGAILCQAQCFVVRSEPHVSLVRGESRHFVQDLFVVAPHVDDSLYGTDINVVGRYRKVVCVLVEKKHSSMVTRFIFSSWELLNEMNLRL